MELLILLGLILLNGVFAMSEIAIVTARKSRLSALAQKGKSSAGTALKLSDDPTQFLSTVQIGITSIGLLSGIYGESVLAEPFALWLQSFGMPTDISSIVSTALVVIVVTFLSIVVGELVPKRIGQLNSEAIACIVAKPMLILAGIARPFVWLLSGSTHLLIRLLRFKPDISGNVTEEDIQAMLLEGSVSGAIEQTEHVMVKNVFMLDDRSVSSLMVPRSDIIFLDIALPLQDNLQRVVQSPHSRFPVCRQSAEELIGVVSAKQLLAQAVSGQDIDLATSAQPCDYVPDSLNGMALLEHFRQSGSQMVFVVDEYGDLQGIVTLQDMMDAVTGAFNSNEQDEQMIIQRADGSFLLDGLLPVIDLKDCLGLSSLPEEGSRQYQTLTGLVMLLLDKVPQTTDMIELGDWVLEIVDMDGKRIDKVLASRKQPVLPQSATDTSSES
ncbi:hemolysin family protein [Chromatiaceae bacterium AAb-1]|nr:hemolysin family protein [Chromatiaceae bacterium AAb-1]